MKELMDEAEEDLQNHEGDDDDGHTSVVVGGADEVPAGVAGGASAGMAPEPGDAPERVAVAHPCLPTGTSRQRSWKS